MIRKDERQLSLLDWTPPEPVAAFDPFLIRGNTFSDQLARAISVSLDDCGMSRAEVCERMSDILTRPISINMLNAYASVQRDGHQISVPRFDALIGATQDRRLLELMAAPRDWAVIERRFLPMIELAAVAEQKKKLARMESGLRRQMGGKF
ncbi:hypothetical protein AZ09_04355 [Acetobacter aceti 1023]|nr:hypothetical protein AZ09_04355 [Acetobacter aceti 1023]